MTSSKSYPSISLDLIWLLHNKSGYNSDVFRRRSRYFRHRLRAIEISAGKFLSAPCSPTTPTTNGADAISPKTCRAQLQHWHDDLHPAIHRSAQSSPPAEPTSIAAGQVNFGLLASSSAGITHTSISTLTADEDNSFKQTNDRTFEKARDASGAPTGVQLSYAGTDSSVYGSHIQFTALASCHAPDIAPEPISEICGLGERDLIQHQEREQSGAQDQEQEEQPEQHNDTTHDDRWTRKRLRSRTGNAVELSHKQKANRQLESTSLSPGRLKMRQGVQAKTSTNVVQFPITELLNGIAQETSQTDRRQEMQRLLAGFQRGVSLFSNRTKAESLAIGTKADVVQLFNDVSRVVQEIEDSDISEQVQRVRNRLALARFYHTYRTAQANPQRFFDFVKGRDFPTTETLEGGTCTKRTLVKERMIDLIFNSPQDGRKRKKDAIRINNWQNLGRPWHELITRFGAGILFLVRKDATNDRHVTSTFFIPCWCFAVTDSQARIRRLDDRKLSQLMELIDGDLNSSE
ncbi:uncharacterized protein KY384_003253 [Bacidia gigantensis]|uniref:uncharacterized protein n=1 Tax=Bacidia gigantensis TaxID=2732470 RepID=UPI001D0498E5|nr:uncharacterized protein KY384_003253 [Bacidia gigantensis]KAG8531622.1 hypothetical protein KY384_003253 [Bacidia gigantensis]